MMPATERKHINRPARWDFTADITILDHGGRELFAKLGNISEAGFMAEAEETVLAGSIIDVELPDRGPVRAEVRWSQGWRFGCQILPS
ncbi:MAG: hypothetical protein EOO23_08150 [Comamonadaceae bacterium]|nr:MAG: hypothetical protein EOO23_08150 [Comamonadaceae bacterium]